MGIWGDLGFWEQQVAVLGKMKVAPGYACLVKAVHAIPF